MPKSDSSLPAFAGYVDHTAQLPPYGYGGHPKPPQPHHKAPHPHEYGPPPPSYHHEYKKPEPVVLIQETFPKQNCTVQDEALRAEICVPDFQTKCDEEGLMNKRLVQGEFCYDVTSTVCTVENTTATIKVCKFDMEREEASSTAKTVEVEFKQECEKNMVTVCEPVTYQPPPPPPPPTYAPPYAAPSQIRDKWDWL